MDALTVLPEMAGESVEYLLCRANLVAVVCFHHHYRLSTRLFATEVSASVEAYSTDASARDHVARG